MATIKLKINNQVLDRFMWLLGKFDKGQIEILESDDEFQKNKKQVQEQLDRLESGKAKVYSVEETNQLLEETIRKYEN